MTKYKYHPLVDSDTDGREKVPMFFSTDEKAVAKSHELYLAEIVLHYYRLHARTAHSKATYSRYDIHCPVCGHVMDAISSHINEHTREATRNNDRLSMTTSTMRPVVCHANPPTDGTFPSEQIQSQHDSTGRAGIGCPTEDRIRDQKVAGSNPVTSTKNLSEDYNLQTFLLFGFARFSLRNPLFPEQIRIPADMPLFGFNRMTTDRGGFMELRVWFRRPFSVRDVHWQKRVEKGSQHQKQSHSQTV